MARRKRSLREIFGAWDLFREWIAGKRDFRAMEPLPIVFANECYGNRRMRGEESCEPVTAPFLFKLRVVWIGYTSATVRAAQPGSRNA